METNVIEINSAGSRISMTYQDELHTEDIICPQNIISGFKKEVVEFLIRMEIVFLILTHSKNPAEWFRIFKAMDPHRKYVLGERRIGKIAEVGGKYYWGLFIPGWPSKAFHTFLKTEINRIYPIHVKTNRFSNIFIAVTNKCPLACEHCYEWEALNKREKCLYLN